MTRKKPTTTDGFGVHQCSVCEEFRLTFGQQKLGGVRYCSDCLRLTLGWVQMTETQRSKVLELYAQFSVHPTVVRELAMAAEITSEVRKANAIGESKRRLMESLRTE